MDISVKKGAKFGLAWLAGSSFYAADQHGLTSRPQGLNNWVLQYTFAGKSLNNEDQQPFAAMAGDILLYPPGVRHFYRHDPDTGFWKHYWVYFSPTRRWSALLRLPERAHGVLGVSLPAGTMRRHVEENMRQMVDLCLDIGPAFQPFAQNHLELVLLWCHKAAAHQHPQDDGRLQAALDWISRNYASIFRVEDLARHAHVSGSRFAHLFREATGISPMKYVERIRINKARELLAATNWSIKKIANEIGYGDPLYFSRIFSRHENFSPRRYRSHWQKMS